MILTDEDVKSLKLEVYGPHKCAVEVDALRTVLVKVTEAAVLEKLRQQKPVAWHHPEEGLSYENHYLGNTPLYAAPVPAAVPDQWSLVRKAVGLAIEACKNATGQRRKIDLMVSGNQITHDVMDTDTKGIK